MEHALTLREARKAKSMSLDALAAAIGRSKSTVSRWENGKCEPVWTDAQQLEAVLETKLTFQRQAVA